MDDLIECLKKTLADTFTFYLKAQFFHWNVEGPDFYQYHKMLKVIYKDVYSAIDPMAENIRTLGGYAPGSFSRYLELSSIKEPTDSDIPIPLNMLNDLEHCNQIVISSIEKCYELAEMHHEHGISNFLAERQGKHKKHGWFLRATIVDYDNI